MWAFLGVPLSVALATVGRVGLRSRSTSQSGCYAKSLQGPVAGKKLDRTGRRVVVGVVCTWLIGLVAGGAMNRLVVCGEFLDDSHVRGTIQAMNQPGLGALPSSGPDGRSLESVPSSGDEAAFDSTSRRVSLGMIGISSSTLFIARFICKEISVREVQGPNP